MNKKKLIASLAAVALVAVVGIGATLAYFTDTEDVSNVVTMGHVDITLTEPAFVYDDNTITNVVPNQTIAKDPTITVADGSEDAYVRAQIEFTGLNTDQQAALLELIEINEGWVLSTDGYYYYQEALEAGEDAVLFEEVVIPAAWGNEVADKSFQINVKAEAIQADNFTPSYNNDEEIIGWGEVTPESYEVEVDAEV